MSSQLDISITPLFSQASGIIKGREDRKIEKARCSGCLRQNAAFQTYSCTYELTVPKTSTRASQTKRQNGRRRWDQEVRALVEGQPERKDCCSAEQLVFFRVQRLRSCPCSRRCSVLCTYKGKPHVLSGFEKQTKLYWEEKRVGRKGEGL